MYLAGTAFSPQDTIQMLWKKRRGDFSTSIPALKKHAPFHKQFLESQRASDRLCFCSWYLATLNCLSFTVCRSFCGTSLKAAYSPQCNLDLSACFHLCHSPFPIRGFSSFALRSATTDKHRYVEERGKTQFDLKNCTRSNEIS